MKINNLFLPVLMMLGFAACIHAMEPVEPMEIAEQPSRIPALQQLSLAAVARHLPELFKNADGAYRIAALPEELRQDLWHRHMFGPDETHAKRNPAVLWLLSQCPIFRRIERPQAERFANPLRECRNMRVLIQDGNSLKVINAETQESFCDFMAEATIACTQFSHDGNHLYVIMRNGKTAILETQTWGIVHSTKLESRFLAPSTIHLNPNNTVAVCGSINMLRMHDILTGAPILDLVRNSINWIEHVKFSQDGNNVFIFFEDALRLLDEDVLHLDRALVPLDMIVHRFDISAVNQVLGQLPHLTLDQLLALQIVHKISRAQEPVEILAHQHIRASYDELPANIRAIIEQALPVISRNIPTGGQTRAQAGANDGGAGNRDGGESDQKRRKIALELMNGA